MSEADEMFEKLGYKKDYDNSFYIEYYNKDKDRSILFEKKYKTIEVPKTPYYCIGMNTLQAINEKVKELRMVR